MTPLEAAWMPTPDAVTTFAEDWIAAWNDHDVDRILAHYRDDVVFTSPFVTMHAFAADGVVHGRDALRRYFVRALSNYPDLRFEPIAVVPGVELGRPALPLGRRARSHRGHGARRGAARTAGQRALHDPGRFDRGLRSGDTPATIATVASPARTREQSRARYPDEEGFVERDGVRVFWERYGDGDPTCCCCRPWSIVHSRVWKAQIPYLARHFRVVAFDPRGNGRSDRPRRPRRTPRPSSLATRSP